MSFIYRIIGYFNDLSDFFYDIYREVLDWPWPFWYAAEFFYEICLLFNKLAWRFSAFAEWLEWAADEIGDILSWSNIKKLIRGWLPDLDDIIDWFYDRFRWVEQQIDEWWQPVKSWVLARIEAIKQWVKPLIEGVESSLANLQQDWDNFKGNIPSLNEIITWFLDPIAHIIAAIINWGALPAKEIGKLIEDTIKKWFPFYDDLVSLWEDIKAFFADPLQWAYDKLDEFFERFW